MAMPRRARAGGSSRSATRLRAPRGSPAASARAAEATRESMSGKIHVETEPLVEVQRALEITRDNDPVVDALDSRCRLPPSLPLRGSMTAFCSRPYVIQTLPAKAHPMLNVSDMGQPGRVHGGA